MAETDQTPSINSELGEKEKNESALWDATKKYEWSISYNFFSEIEIITKTKLGDLQIGWNLQKTEKKKNILLNFYIFMKNTKMKEKMKVDVNLCFVIIILKKKVTHNLYYTE